jgi:hypothetical protein
MYNDNGEEIVFCNNRCDYRPKCAAAHGIAVDHLTNLEEDYAEEEGYVVASVFCHQCDGDEYMDLKTEAKYEL